MSDVTVRAIQNGVKRNEREKLIGLYYESIQFLIRLPADEY
jgi:hypothetical protein